MLEQKDLEMLRLLLRSELTTALQENNEVLRAERREENEKLRQELLTEMHAADERLRRELREELLAEMDRRLLKSEDMLLNEMERTREILDQKISKVQAEVDELKQYAKLSWMREDNTSSLLQMYMSLEKRVEHLENQIA